MTFEREKVKSVIFTSNAKIEGYVHIPPGGRITDFMNNIAKPFIPITDVVMTFTDGKVITTNLLQLNKDYIIALVPEGSINEN